MSTTVSSNANAGSNSAAVYAQLSAGNSTTQSTAEASADRFLKLLVAQMKNQDPLSPMDNAQVTSQMAQINTVSGIDKLNETVKSLSGQFVQLQAMQGAQLVGKNVLVAGNSLALDAAGKTSGGFDLAGAADAVKVEVLSPAGRVIDTVDLGAETAGRHSFDWTAPEAWASNTGLTFRVAATAGANTVSATALARDQVSAVSSGSGGLTLELASGKSLAYGDVKAFSD